MILNRPTLFEGESIESYVYRISKYNYCKTHEVINEIGRNTKLGLLHHWDSGQLKKLSDLTGVKQSALYHATLDSIFNGVGITNSRQVVACQDAKYCPLCIQEQCHYQLKWSIRPLTVCSHHHVLLVDRCYQCGSRIKLPALMSGICPKCDFLYRDCPGMQLDNASVIVQSQVDMTERLKGNADCNGLYFRDYVLFARCAFHLFEGLTSFVEPREEHIQVFFNKKQVGFDNYKMSIALANVHWLYSDLDRFYQLLTVFSQKHHDIRYEQKRQFEMLFRSKTYTFIEDVYDRYWIDQFEHGAIRRDFSVLKKQKTISKLPVLPKEETKREYRITSVRLERLRQNGQVNVKISTHGSLRQYRIDRASVHAALRKQSQFVNRVTAAAMLGIHVNTLRKITKANLITTRTAPSGEQLIQLRDLKRLLGKCNNTVVAKPEGATLHVLIKKYNQMGYGLVRLLQLILEKRLTVTSVRPDGNLADIRLDEGEIQDLIEHEKKLRMSKEGYNLQEVQKILSLGEHTSRELIRRKILTPEHTHLGKDGRKHYRFNKREIDEFDRNHVRLTQAAQQYGLTRRTLHYWLETGKIHNYMHGVTHRPLLRRAEIEQQILMRRSGG